MPPGNRDGRFSLSAGRPLLGYAISGSDAFSFFAHSKLDGCRSPRTGGDW